MVIVFPLASSNRSIVFISMIIIIAQDNTTVNISTMKSPDHMAIEKYGTQSIAGPNFPSFTHGCIWNSEIMYLDSCSFA